MTTTIAAPATCGVTAMDPDAARGLTDRIKVGVEAVWELVKQAYVERAWSALGYSSWDDYCTREFGTARLRLPREERAEVVASLRESGLSIRAIAAATGDSIGTVHDALSPGVQNRTPDNEDALADELLAAAQTPGAPTEFTPGQTRRVAEALDRARQSAEQATEPPLITGLDGKQYRKPKAKPANTFSSKFSHALSQVQQKALELDILTKKPEFAQHLDSLTHHRDSVVWAQEILTRVLDQLKTDQGDLLGDLCEVAESCEAGR